MKITKEEIRLDPAYPFRIDHQRLQKKDSRRDHYHWHSCFEITCILSGEGRYFVNDSIYEVTGGDIILFNNLEPHGWEIPSGALDLLVIVFMPEYIAGGMSLMDYDYLKPFVERGSNFRNRIGHEDPLSGKITALMQGIDRENAEQTTGYRLMIKADVLKMLTLLIRYSQDSEKSSALLENKKQKMIRLSSVFEYINSHYTEDITLGEVAKIAYMSPNYFSSYFRRVTGQTFSGYISTLRITRADKLLLDTGESILDVAAACGFRNMSNFYRIHKKIRGMTPSEYLAQADKIR